MDAKLKIGVPTLLLGLSLGFAWGRGGAPTVDEGLRQAVKEQGERLDALPAVLRTVSQPSRCAVAASSNAMEPLTLRREVSRAVREALVGTERDPSPPPGPSESKPAASSQSSLKARDEGMRLIDSALSTRRWSEAEEQQLSSLLSRMDRPHQEEVLSKLTTRINDGTLEMTLP